MLKRFKDLDRLLRGDATRITTLERGALDVSARGLSLVVVLLGALYGLCMALFTVITTHGTYWQQLLASAVKVPALFFLTLAVTAPSLYVFNALVGSRLTLLSVLRLLVAALGVMLAVLASLGTIVAFFSLSTTSYPFMILLNVMAFAIAGALGLKFLFQTLNRLSLARQATQVPAAPAPAPGTHLATDPGSDASPAAQPPPAPPLLPARMPGALDPMPGKPAMEVRTVFRIWVIVFALVGAQMSWVLRPFVGDPKQTFAWFRPREGNFFEGVADAIGNLMRSDGSGRPRGDTPTSRPSGTTWRSEYR